MGVLVTSISPILLVLCGLSLGFLTQNWPPAKIFMGDVGSTFLGFIFAGFFFFGIAENLNMFWPLMTLSLLFTADASFTLIKRALRKEKFWRPHREHFYQRAYNLGMTHKSILIRALLLNIVLATVTIVGHVYAWGWMSLVIGLCVLSLAALRIQHLEGVHAR